MTTQSPEEIARDIAMECVNKILGDVLPVDALPLLTKTETHLLFVKIKEAIDLAIAQERATLVLPERKDHNNEAGAINFTTLGKLMLQRPQMAYACGFNDALDEITRLNAPTVCEGKCEQINKIISALEFYADPENWSRRTSGHGESSCDVIKDDGGYESVAGKRAREALCEFYKLPESGTGGE